MPQSDTISASKVIMELRPENIGKEMQPGFGG